MMSFLRVALAWLAFCCVASAQVGQIPGGLPISRVGVRLLTLALSMLLLGLRIVGVPARAHLR